jgi:uncharacterized protein DUF4279
VPHARDERYVWYALVGDFDPDDITATARLTPSKIGRKGEPVSARTTRLRTASTWKMDSRLTPSDEFHAHLEDLIATLRPGWDALTALGQVHQAFVTAAIYCHESQGPLVEVNPQALAALAELRATLGFDLYAVPEDEPNDEAQIRPLTRAELGNLRGARREENDHAEPT